MVIVHPCVVGWLVKGTMRENTGKVNGSSDSNLSLINAWNNLLDVKLQVSDNYIVTPFSHKVIEPRNIFRKFISFDHWMIKTNNTKINICMIILNNGSRIEACDRVRNRIKWAAKINKVSCTNCDYNYTILTETQ